MITTALEDEVTSINSIYGDDTLSQIADASALYAIRFPPRPLITLRLEFPKGYPDVPPAILGPESSAHEGARRGEGRRMAGMVTEVLQKVYQPGQPCIFDLIEDVSELLTQEEGDVQHDDTSNSEAVETFDMGDRASDSNNLGQNDAPCWALSTVVAEKKSVFVARAATVSSPAQARLFLTHLKGMDKKVAKATHNITAWRIRCSGNPEISYQDCDDDGETAAGGRLLHLMQLMNIWDVMIVVTRWYGGVHLGPDRFRIINQVARDALAQGSFLEEADKDHGRNEKKKTKK